MAGLLLARDFVPRQEPPDRRMAEADAGALPDLLAQFEDRQVRQLLELREDEIGVRLDAPRSAIAAHLHWRHLSRGLDALRPADRGRGTDVEPRRSLAPRIPPAIAFITFSRISIDNAITPSPPIPWLRPGSTAPLRIWEFRALY